MSLVTPIAKQREFWNRWNTETREKGIEEISRRQAQTVRRWLEASGRTDLDILEVGCGAGWFCDELSAFGSVTGTDLSDEVLERARQRTPAARFLAGDFMTLDLEAGGYDVVVTLEVLSHMANQRRFIKKIADLLRPGGTLMMATQNRTVLERYNRIDPPQPGQLRRWVDRDELAELLGDAFDIVEIGSVTPRANKGIMRYVNSRKLNAPVRAVFGDRVERLKERLGLGWTLMALARKRDHA